MLRGKCQFSDFNACWQDWERSWSFLMTECLRNLFWVANKNQMKRATIVEKRTVVLRVSTISALTIRSQAFSTQMFCSSFSSGSIEDCQLLSTISASPRRYLWSMVVIFSCLAVGVAHGFNFDLLARSGLITIRLVLYAMERSKNWKPATVRGGAFSFLSWWGPFCFLEIRFVVTERVCKASTLFLRSCFLCLK